MLRESTKDNARQLVLLDSTRSFGMAAQSRQTLTKEKTRTAKGQAYGLELQ